KPVLKLLQSAIANAKHNYELPVERLFIAKIMVDGGPVLKRWMPKAHGRATPVRERTSHITLVLAAREVEKKDGEKKKDKKEKIASVKITASKDATTKTTAVKKNNK
ncbi:50S ribosomal protein L22, partial [Patescibacteria group bacterium]|nr:50S ribosomal protein L22 [Patescibacteria group bacterium]